MSRPPVAPSTDIRRRIISVPVLLHCYLPDRLPGGGALCTRATTPGTRHPAPGTGGTPPQLLTQWRGTTGVPGGSACASMPGWIWMCCDDRMIGIALRVGLDLDLDLLLFLLKGPFPF